MWLVAPNLPLKQLCSMLAYMAEKILRWAQLKRARAEEGVNKGIDHEHKLIDDIQAAMFNSEGMFQAAQIRQLRQNAALKAVQNGDVKAAQKILESSISKKR